MVGAIHRAASDVKGDEYLSQFQVVLLITDEKKKQAILSVYSSETDVWGNPISTACSSMVATPNVGTLIGRCLYWSVGGRSHGNHMLELVPSSDRCGITLIFSKASPWLGYCGGWRGWLPLSVSKPQDRAL